MQNRNLKKFLALSAVTVGFFLSCIAAGQTKDNTAWFDALIVDAVKKGIRDQVIDSDIMPPGNITGITENERNILRVWIEKGANINN